MDKNPFKTSLQIQSNLKRIKYDGKLYKIKKVQKIPAGSLNDTVKCCKGIYHTLSFDHVFHIKKKKCYVTFCNRCKVLFVKEIDD